MPSDSTALSALDRARRKAYWRLLPLVSLCYMIAYIDRSNVSIAKLTMSKSLPAFDNEVIGFGGGIFFLGYFLLEIPGSVLVERWSARLWISRIMITWGIMAALTAWVTTPTEFYIVRFLLGLAEAGFFPGVIVYLTHWFPNRDRTRALAYFMIAQPLAQIVSPKISNFFIKFGTTETINGVAVQHPYLFGLEGWQWVYIFWGLPAVLLGVFVLFAMPDRPKNARWLTADEQAALTAELEKEATERTPKQRMTLWQALRHPAVLWLSAAYFCTVSASLGLELFLPSILEKWYQLKVSQITWLVILPPVFALCGQLLIGWNSDRTKERRLHSTLPVIASLIALAIVPLTQGHLVATMVCFVIIAAGLKAYLPAFWALPSLFLTQTAAAGSIGLINSIGNLGAFYGQTLLGKIEKVTGSFVGGMYWLCGSMMVFLIIIFSLGLGRREKQM